MTEILKTIELIEDKRQQKKIRHKLLDIVVIMLFAKVCEDSQGTLVSGNYALAFGCDI